jgi:hypothetical protein
VLSSKVCVFLAQNRIVSGFEPILSLHIERNMKLAGLSAFFL